MSAALHYPLLLSNIISCMMLGNGGTWSLMITDNISQLQTCNIKYLWSGSYCVLLQFLISSSGLC